jgi:hypothetical protein
MRPSPRTRAFWLPAVVVLVVALLLVVAFAPSLRALGALIVISLPSYLIVWPVLAPRLGSAGAFTVASGLAIGMIAIGRWVMG